MANRKVEKTVVRQTERVRYTLYLSALAAAVAALCLAALAKPSAAATIAFVVLWTLFLALILAGQAVHICALRRDGFPWLSGEVGVHAGLCLVLLIALISPFFN